MHWVITGAGRGIGFAIAKELSHRNERVTATVRDEESRKRLLELNRELRVVLLDVTEPNASEQLATAIGSEAVDVLVNNAGVYGGGRSLAQFNEEEALRTLRINSIAPILLTRALAPNLQRAHTAKVANISSMMGSIHDNSSGGSYSYRMSKAALNMATRSLAHDLRAQGVVCVAMNPGWVRTEMGGSSAPTSAEDCARGIIDRILALSDKDSGAFVDYRGHTREPLPW